MKSAVIEKPGAIKVKEHQAHRVSRPHDVLVKVAACGICGTDVHIFHGEYIGSYPMTPGHEFSGVVVEVGEKVTRFAPGPGWPWSRTSAATTARRATITGRTSARTGRPSG